MLRVFEIDDGETHLFAASCEERAVELYEEMFDYDEDFTVRLVDPDEEISVRSIDEPGEPLVTKPAWAWATEEGCFSTTVTNLSACL